MSNFPGAALYAGETSMLVDIRARPRLERADRVASETMEAALQVNSVHSARCTKAGRISEAWRSIGADYGNHLLLGRLPTHAARPGTKRARALQAPKLTHSWGVGDDVPHQIRDLGKQQARSMKPFRCRREPRSSPSTDETVIRCPSAKYAKQRSREIVLNEA